MATVCKRVTYSGQVQGVGFRYTARRVASGFPVTGYVRNLKNGDVELIAEGEADTLAAYLAAVAERMAGYIRETVVDEQTLGGYADFTIRP